MQDSPARTLRERVYTHLEPRAWPAAGLSPTNKLLIGLILLSAFVAVLETEPVIIEGRQTWFIALEWAIALCFGVEYLLRAWVCSLDPRYADGWRGRLRYLISFGALVDLAALLPSILLLAGAEGFLLRTVRLWRILRLARLGRFSRAIQAIGEAVRARRYELLLSGGIAALLLLTSSTLLYFIEGGVQPEAFGSIPRAMWWSIATLTTVGYGDLYPITALGRLFAALTALTGIGLIAMPTGILAAAFSEALQRQKQQSTRDADDA